MNEYVGHQVHVSTLDWLAILVLISGCNPNRSLVTNNAQEANASLHQRFCVPDDATDIRLQSTPIRSTVNFVLDEQAVVAWISGMDWEKRSIEVDAPAVFIPLNEEGKVGTAVVVTNGIAFSSAIDGDAPRFDGCFDADTGRVSIVYSSR